MGVGPWASPIHSCMKLELRSLKAASPAAGGRNPILTSLALDRTSGTLDPAFEAHASVTEHWALAAWDNWFTDDQLQRAIDGARRKLNNAKGSWWSVVAGPPTATLATLRKLKWTCVDATTFTTDEGRRLDLHTDPPQVVATEVKEAVRRRRWLEADAILPRSPM